MVGCINRERNCHKPNCNFGLHFGANNIDQLIDLRSNRFSRYRKGTPEQIVETLNGEISAALADPEMRARLTELGGTVIRGTPAEFGKLIADETEKWAKVIKFANIKPE